MYVSYDEITPVSYTTTKTTARSWLVCLTAGLFFFYEFFQLNMLNTLEPYLMSTFGVAADAINDMSAYYFYAEMAFLFPAGLLLDRYSVKALILISMIVCVIGTYGFAQAPTLHHAAFYRFLEGWGAALCFLSSLKLSSRWFHPRQLALISGLLVTMAMVGGMLAQTPLEYVVQAIGWRQAIAYDAYLGIVFILMIIIWVKDYPEGYEQRFMQEHAQLSTMGFIESILLAARNIQTWLAGIYTCLMNLPIFLLGALNGSLYLTQIHGLSATQAATVSSMVFLGTIFGSPLAGYLSDLIEQRRLPMILGAILSIAAILPLFVFSHINYHAMLCVFFILGLITSTQVLTYPLVTESNPKLLTGTALSIASLLIMSGGAIFQPLFGKLLSLQWDHTIIQGVAVYSRSDYIRAMLIIPTAFVLSLALCYFIKETYCLPYEKQR